MHTYVRTYIYATRESRDSCSPSRCPAPTSPLYILYIHIYAYIHTYVRTYIYATRESLDSESDSPSRCNASPRFRLNKICFRFKALLWESIILVLPPPPPATPTRLHYCTLIAQYTPRHRPSLCLNRPLLDVLRRNPKNELEKSKKLEIAVPRPLSSTYDYVITTQRRLLHAYCAIYAPPSTLPFYAIHHRLLVMAISCKGQPEMAQPPTSAPYIYIHMYAYIHTYVRTYIPMCMQVCVCMCVHMGIYLTHVKT